MSIARVKLWGRTIGVVSWDSERSVANFEFEPDFVQSKIEVAPLMMPLSSSVYSFQLLSRKTFNGLPGMLADSLPDKFGNALIDAWLAKEGRSPASFNPVERLCYVGRRGMGALEYYPSQEPTRKGLKEIDIAELVNLASEILTTRESLACSFESPERKKALQDILRVGTSAGGARAKALIAWNSSTNEVRSGQILNEKGFTYWLLKFDGVRNNFDKELNAPKGFGCIEYAYYLMALESGIEMSECRLLVENDRSHFITKRFDRTDDGEKIYMQSLGAIAHFDFEQAGAYSYEQVIAIMRKLGLSMVCIEELFRRMVFNILARNQDDHVKNIAFLMDKAGKWRLSPAFDVTYSYNPDGFWTNKHQMSMNGKRDFFCKQDFIDFAKNVAMQENRALRILDEVQSALKVWHKFAEKAGVPDSVAQKIASVHRSF